MLQLPDRSLYIPPRALLMPRRRRIARRAAAGASSAGSGATDPFISNVKLLVNVTGANGSTTFTDVSPSARGNATALGNAQVNTGELLTDGTGDGLTWPDSADWILSAGSSDAFTVDGFVKVHTLALSKMIICQYGGGGLDIAWSVNTHHATLGGLTAGHSSDGTFGAGWQAMAIAGAGMVADTEYYFAYVKDSANEARLYLGTPGGAGSKIGVLALTNGAVNDRAVVLSVGCNAGGGDSLDGRMRAWRVTKGTCRYTGDSITCPTAPFPTI